MRSMTRRRKVKDNASSRYSSIFFALLLLFSLGLFFQRDPTNEPFQFDKSRIARTKTTQSSTTNRIAHSLPDRNALVTSIRSNRGDLENLCRALGSLIRLPDRGSTPVLIYTERPPLESKYQAYLKECNSEHRQLVFPPESSKGKSFWIAKVFILSSIANYDVIMRLDPGSCWKENSDLVYLPGLPNTTISYHAGTDSKVNQGICGSLLQFSKAYAVKNHVVIRNPHLWYDMEELWRRQQKCIAYQTHFEVIRLNWMKQDAVQHWLAAAMDYDHTLDDQLLRSFTVVMFAPGVIPISKTFPVGYSYSIGRPGASCKSLPGIPIQM